MVFHALRFVFMSGVSADCSGLVVSHALRFVFLSGVSADYSGDDGG